jgi:serine/threonine-protein kinase HipA
VRPEEEAAPATHEGFERVEVIDRGADFIEYAFERGAPVAGSTGAQGEAPKFLLSEDHAGRWHAEGALGDAQIARHWLVKFPRGRHESDLAILEEEARYMELARQAGLRANAPLLHQDGCLFVPRFDRDGGERLGLETIASLSGIAEYGITQSLQASARAVAEHCTDPAAELRELLLRDVLNLAVGNTDNHVRNTSVLKHADGRVELSPIYDLAPMILDRDGIPRACRWGEREHHGRVDWAGVIDDLGTLGADTAGLCEAMREMADFVGSLARRMTEQGIAPALVERLRQRQTDLSRDLGKAGRS